MSKCESSSHAKDIISFKLSLHSILQIHIHPFTHTHIHINIEAYSDTACMNKKQEGKKEYEEIKMLIILCI